MCKTFFSKFSAKTLLNIILTAALLAAAGCESAPTTRYDELAKCITNKDAKMYGTFWCHNCTTQKNLFGGSSKYINYIECDPRAENSQAEVCVKKGITAYPTWEFSDKSRLEGVRPMEELAKKTNCELKTDGGN